MTDNKLSREEYFETMFKTTNKKGVYNYKTVENALNRAHEIRKFEINLYWERSKYMYVMIGAIFYVNILYGMFLFESFP